MSQQVTSRRPAVRAAVDERAMAPAFKSPDFPHRTCLAAGIFSGAVLFLRLPDIAGGRCSCTSPGIKLHAGVYGSGLASLVPFDVGPKKLHFTSPSHF